MTTKKNNFEAQIDAILAGKAKLDFLPWCYDHIRTEYGKLTFDNHKALVEIYEEHHPYKVILKGPQIGISQYGYSLALWIADQLHKDCIYYAPDDNKRDEFMETRAKMIIERSAYLRKKTRTAGNEIKIGQNIVYYRGLFTEKAAISIPSDANIYDEVDYIPAKHMKVSKDRIAASKMGWLIYYCKGMIAGAGIDEMYSRSDQRKWLVRCPGCRKDHILEEEFPECIDFKKTAVICVKCGHQLDRQAGRWVAERPDVTVRRGYRVPQLVVGQISLKTICDDYQDIKEQPSELAEFSASRLAIVKAGSRQPITIAIIKKSKRYEHKMVARAAWSFLGIDVGDTCHLVLHDILPNRKRRVLYAETCHSDNLEARVAALWPQYGIICGCGDAMPYAPTLRSIARRFAGKFFLCRYTETAPTLRIEKEGETEDQTVDVVKVDRDKSLDNTCDLFKRDMVVLPDDPPPDFEKHLMLLAKEIITDGRGNKIERYRKNVANHYGMGMNYSRLASLISKIKPQNFVGLDPIFFDQQEAMV
jgi:hypothetical protein